MLLMSLDVLRLPLLPPPDTNINIINDITANNIKHIIKIFYFFIFLSSLCLNYIILSLKSV
jgi:hypothetical protein